MWLMWVESAACARRPTASGGALWRARIRVYSYGVNHLVGGWKRRGSWKQQQRVPGGKRCLKPGQKAMRAFAPSHSHRGRRAVPIALPSPASALGAAGRCVQAAGVACSRRRRGGGHAKERAFELRRCCTAGHRPMPVAAAAAAAVAVWATAEVGCCHYCAHIRAHIRVHPGGLAGSMLMLMHALSVRQHQCEGQGSVGNHGQWAEASRHAAARGNQLSSLHGCVCAAAGEGTRATCPRASPPPKSSRAAMKGRARLGVRVGPPQASQLRCPRGPAPPSYSPHRARAQGESAPSPRVAPAHALARARREAPFI